jgi:hypothetical protein
MRDAPAAMAWAPGGTFGVGSEAVSLEEAPVREVGVDGFGFRWALRS